MLWKLKKKQVNSVIISFLSSKNFSLSAFQKVILGTQNISEMFFLAVLVL